MKLVTATISPDGRYVELVWDDTYRSRFHAIWLRDNALDPDTRSTQNGQRLITVLDIPHDTIVSMASVTGTGDLTVALAPEMKDLTFPGEWLRENAYDDPRRRDDGCPATTTTTWDSGMQGRLPVANWHRIKESRESLGQWLADIRQYGIALLRQIPTGPASVCDVAELFGYVRQTNYGRWFDVKSDVEPDNLANTSLGLQAHTDNPYRDPVPTLQLLACLENSVDGGDSIVVDGFHAAGLLRSQDPAAFDLLVTYRACFEYAGSRDVLLRASKPIIARAPDSGEITGISFNSRSMAPLISVPFNDMAAYYDAYRKFSLIIEDPDNQVSFRLQPGELFIVDNTRVLHARKAFSGPGRRLLQGCYADKDSLLSTLRVIENRYGLKGAA